MSEPCRKVPCFHGESPFSAYSSAGSDLVPDVGAAALVLKLVRLLNAQAAA